MNLDDEQVAIQQAYDDYPYESYPFPVTHPERLSTLASLFGLETADLGQCRVLELGCASGGNLIPMAAQMTRSQFFGIDLSGKQVAEANETIKALKLKNIKIEQKDILDLGGKIRKFDYIICHGVYSWVPANVQIKILQICKQYLSDNGVAYISYNTYPGWRMRESVRDMMRFHTSSLDKAKDKVAQSRALLKFLVDSVDTENNAYGKYLESELNILSNAGDAYLAHDHLERNNSPVYFYEFCQEADEQGLQYLAESEFQSMLAGNFPSRVAETLTQVGNNIILQEQYMDFLRNRTFRSTLLCHKEIDLNRNIDAGLVKNMHISALPMRILDKQEADENPVTYLSQIGIRVNIPDGIISAAFQVLNSCWPATVSFESLYEQAALGAGVDGDQYADMLAADLLKLYAAKAIELHALPSVFTTTVSEKPKVSDLARYQAASGHALTNLRHELAKINEPTRLLVLLLDGKNNQDDLLEKMLKMVGEGKLVLREGEVEITEEDKQHKYAKQFLDRILTELAKRALLVS
jgi:methyltransferase-like protein/cyclopropane fatty-acyl-phospholipid synthase-like methyltransferase